MIYRIMHALFRGIQSRETRLEARFLGVESRQVFRPVAIAVCDVLGKGKEVEQSEEGRFPVSRQAMIGGVMG